MEQSTAGATPQRIVEWAWDALRTIVEPELGDNIVDLGMVQSVQLRAGGELHVVIALTTAACPLRGQIRSEVRSRTGSLEGVLRVEVETTEMSAQAKAELMARARWKASQSPRPTMVPARTRVLFVSSGKGGVGKSSVAVNLASALAATGHRVGVLDADIGGFSVPRLLGVSGQLEAVRDPDDPSRTLIQPHVKDIGRGQLRIVSMGFLAGEDDAIMWRGDKHNRAVQHFLEEVDWDDIDYLVVDTPPGTGDVQLGLARMLPSAQVLIVTTPALAAQRVAARAAGLARKSYLHILGVVENMSGFVCEHGTRHELFGHGGGTQLAHDIGAPVLAEIPLQASVSAGNDSGEPAALEDAGLAGQAFRRLAERVEELCPPVQMAGCSARIAEALSSLPAAAPTH
ncbi:MAG TPA: P-loop NTPase [Acidimicrobiales bacterium]|nr:P-loop NTPase [Acidimicrobiales bacterium]